MFRLARMVLVVVGLSVPVSVFGQEEMAPASVAAKEAFEQMKAGKMDAFAARLHPDDLKGFSAMVTDLVKAAEARNDPNTKVLTDAIGTSAELEAKEPADVTAGFMRLMTQRIPGYDQMMRETKFEIVGEVPAGADTVAVVYRFVLPTPQAVLVGKKGETWYLQLDPGYKQMAAAIKKALAGEAPPDPGAVTLESVEVLGSLPEGEAQANLVVRTIAKVGEDKLEKLAVLPVGKGEAEWDLLAPEKKTELEKALKEKLDPNRR